MEPILNIVHLDNRQDRRISFMRQIFEHKIHAQVWPGIKAEKPWTGISRAFKQVVLHAKNSNLPFCVIAEDDFNLTHTDSWKLFLEDRPLDFDLYFGGISGGVVEEDWNYVNEPNVKPVTNSSGMFLFAVHERFYDTFLAADEDKEIDRWFGIKGYEAIENALGRKPVYKVRWPLICTCIDGMSDNSGKFMWHDRFFLPYQVLRS